MQTREQQTEIAIRVRLAKLRELARQTTKQVQQLGILPDQHRKLRAMLLAHLLAVTQRNDDD